MSVTAERRFGLDLLRAAAVLLVVIAHGSVLAVPLWIPGQEIIFMAFLGVELFFVLSGFLVGGLLLDELEANRDAPGRGWVLHFWSRRWLRTLPNYYLVLGLNFGFVALVAQPLPESWPLYFLFSQNLVSAHPNFFGEAWSLAVEEWFYLLAPLVALAFSPLLRSPRAVLAGFTALLLGYLLLRLGVALWFDPAWDAGVRKLTALRLDGIAYGVLMVWLYARLPRLRALKGSLALCGSLLLLACAALFLSVDVDRSLAARSLLFSAAPLACALLLPWAAEFRFVPLPMLFKRWVVRLAVLSYSLYLLHMLFVRAFLAWASAPLGWDEVLLRSAVYFGGALAASWLLYRGFERPILSLRDRWVPR
jgi:peptidoglycan/LPS O-acetylase OafA/YrhL